MSLFLLTSATSISFQQSMLLSCQEKVRSSSLFDFLFIFLPSCMWRAALTQSDTKNMNQSCQRSASRKWIWKPVPLCYIRSAWEEFTHLSPVHHALVYLTFLSSRGNFTVPKLSESNMGFGVLGVFLGLLLEVSTHGPPAVPRTSWRHQGKEWNLKKDISLIYLICYGYNYYLYEGDLAMRYITGFNTFISAYSIYSSYSCIDYVVNQKWRET